MQLNKTGLIFFPAFDWSISPTHPEREERLLYTRDQIFEEGIPDSSYIREYKPRLAAKEDIRRVHFCVPDVEDQTTEAHLISAGSALKLGDALMKNEIANGFVMARPPGHHAMRVVHGNRGFCNTNNEAILVEYLRRKYGLKRIAIVDTDVHHGDGTQDIFYHDPDVLCISLHQDGRTIFPGTGFVHETGGPGAYLKNINIPLPPGTGDEGFLRVWREIIKPVLNKFDPQLIINSAGQDNHFTDPLASMRVSAQAYGKLTEELQPDIAVLEGGYAIETALPYVNLAILLALAKQDYSKVIEPQFTPAAVKQDEGITLYIDDLIRYWQDALSEDVPSKEDLFGEGKVYQRKKSIYYDTDGIRENQQETVQYCPNCPGLYQVSSTARDQVGQGNSIWGLSIPLFACDKCLEKGYKMWEQAIKEGKEQKTFAYYYLQDKKNDNYLKE